MVIPLRRIGLGCSGFVLKFFDACSGHAEVISPKPIKIGFGCGGLGLLPLWFFALYQLGFTPRFVRLTLVSAVSPFLVFVSKMFSNLMQCLLSWRLKRLTTVPPASSSAESAVCTC